MTDDNDDFTLTDTVEWPTSLDFNQLNEEHLRPLRRSLRDRGVVSKVLRTSPTSLRIELTGPVNAVLDGSQALSHLKLLLLDAGEKMEDVPTSSSETPMTDSRLREIYQEVAALESEAIQLSDERAKGMRRLKEIVDRIRLLRSEVAAAKAVL